MITDTKSQNHGNWLQGLILLLCAGALMAQPAQPADGEEKSDRTEKVTEEEKAAIPAAPVVKPAVASPAPVPVRPAPDLSWMDGMRWTGLVRFRPEGRANQNFDRINDEVVFSSTVCTVKRSSGKTCADSGGKESAAKISARAAKPSRADFVGQKIQLGVEKTLSEDTKLVILLQDARVWGGSAGSANGLGTSNSRSDESTDIREGYIEAKNLLGPVGLKAGRQIFAYGDQRLVGHLDWTNVGRSFDGFRLMYDSEIVSSHLWASVIGEDSTHYSGVTDGNESSATLKDAYFGGWYNTIKASDVALVDIYYLGVFKQYIQQAEPLVTYPNPAGAPGTVNNDSPKLVTDQYGVAFATRDRSTQRSQLNTVGLRLTNRTKEGKAEGMLDWTLEGAKQFGPTGTEKTPEFYDILLEDDDYTLRDADNNTVYRLKADPQGGYYRSAVKAHNFITKKEQYDGYAGSAEVGLTLNKSYRIGVEAQQGSGDADPNDFKSRTFNNLFPTNHLHYGYADLLSWQNMRAGSVNFSAKVGESGNFRIAYWKAEKDQGQDAWYVASGAKHSVATPGAPTAYGEPTGATKQSKEKRIAKTIMKRELWKQFQTTALFDELDVTYSTKHKGIGWEFGYSYIEGGNGIRAVKDDIGYAFMSKYLDTILYEEGVVTASNKVENGDFIVAPPRFRSVSHFAYIMMTMKF